MKRSLTAATTFIFSLVSGGAYATGAIECNDPEGRASVNLTIGSLPILAVVGAQISTGEHQWSLGDEGDSAIISGQAFGTSDEMRIDFTDPNAGQVVAEVRLFSASEGKDTVLAGTLKMTGIGAYALICAGP